MWENWYSGYANCLVGGSASWSITSGSTQTVTYNVTTSNCSWTQVMNPDMHELANCTASWVETEQGLNNGYMQVLQGQMNAYAQAWQPIKLTPEQKAAHLELHRQREVAASRADELLLSFLSDSQADQYKRDKRFDLVVGGRIYRMHKGRSGNIQLIENGKPVAKYCAHPEIWMPDSDNVLAQMLALQTDEAAFLKLANRTALV